MGKLPARNLIILILLSILLGLASEVKATVCIIDDVTGEVWCEWESPLSPVGRPQAIYFPIISR